MRAAWDPTGVDACSILSLPIHFPEILAPVVSVLRAPVRRFPHLHVLQSLLEREHRSEGRILMQVVQAGQILASLAFAVALSSTGAGAQSPGQIRVATPVPATFFPLTSEHVAIHSAGAVVGSPATAGGGAAYMYSFNTATRAATLAATVTGGAGSVNFGECVKPMSNGFAVSDSAWNFQRGRVHVFSSTGVPGPVINGPAATVRFGYHFVSLGDLSGDGIDELAITEAGAGGLASVRLWWSNTGAITTIGSGTGAYGVYSVATKVSGGNFAVLDVMDTGHRVGPSTVGAVFRYRITNTAAITLESRYIGTVNTNLSQTGSLDHVSDTNNDSLPELVLRTRQPGAPVVDTLRMINMPFIAAPPSNGTSIASVAHFGNRRYSVHGYADVNNDGLRDIVLMRYTTAAANSFEVYSGAPAAGTLNLITSFTAAANESLRGVATGIDINNMGAAGNPFKVGGGAVTITRSLASGVLSLDAHFVAEHQDLGGGCALAGPAPTLTMVGGRPTLGAARRFDVSHTPGAIGLLEIAVYTGTLGIGPCGGSYWTGVGGVPITWFQIPAGGTWSLPYTVPPTTSLAGVRYVVQAVFPSAMTGGWLASSGF